MQTLRTIFLHPERNISTPYIHALAPRLVEYLYSDKSKQVTNDMDLTFTLECISTVEALIGLADLSNRKLFYLNLEEIFTTELYLMISKTLM